MWPDRVEELPVALDFEAELVAVVDLVAVEMLVLQRLEGTLAHAVLAGTLDPRADVDQLGSAVDEAGEVVRLEARPVVGDDADRAQLSTLRVGDVLQQRPAEEPFGLDDRALDCGDCVAVVLRRRYVPAQLDLAPVVGAAADPPGAAHPGFELAEVHLPDLVRPVRWDEERRLPRLRVLPALGLVVDLEHAAGALQCPVDGRVGGVDAVDPQQARDRVRAPLRVPVGVGDREWLQPVR